MSASLLALAPLLKTAPLQAIARIHGVVGSAALGPERARPARATPRPPTGCAGCPSCCSSGTEAPALLVAAVVHADLATAAPFASHNGIVARAVERLVLVSRGVDAKSLVVPEAGHLALRAQYESNLGAYRDGGPRGVHAWVLYAAEAYAAGAEASPLRGYAGRERHMRTAPDHVDQVPSLTRDAMATKRATSNCCPGRIRGSRPYAKGRSPRGYRAHVLPVELSDFSSTPLAGARSRVDFCRRRWVRGLRPRRGAGGR